jgi:hypothetical protein
MQVAANVINASMAKGKSRKTGEMKLKFAPEGESELPSVIGMTPADADKILGPMDVGARISKERWIAQATKPKPGQPETRSTPLIPGMNVLKRKRS